MMYDTSALSLFVRPPFRLDLTVWALRRRKTNIMDRWDGGRYSRVIVLGHDPVKMTAVQEETREEPEIHVTLQSKREITPQMHNDARLLLEKTLGLRIDLQPFYAMARSNDILRPLVERFMGVRPPRFPDLFEAIINAVTKMNDREAVEYMTALRGIGRWSAEYVLLRGLGRIDSFPGDEIGARNNLERVFRLGHKPRYEEIKSLTSQWHPYEGLVYFHLLLEKLHHKGVV